VLKRWPVRWLVDHFGCCRAAGWHAAPLPLPPSRALVQLGRDHLAWVRDELQVQVGLENLALALCLDDVLVQPDLVDAMVRPVGGVVLLDLHNLWCQAGNFDLDPWLGHRPTRHEGRHRGDRALGPPRTAVMAKPRASP